MNKEKIKKQWFVHCTYKETATVEWLLAQKEAVVADKNAKLEEPYTVAEWKIGIQTRYEQDPELTIEVERWETDKEQAERIKRNQVYQKMEAEKEAKKRANLADPEYEEYKRLQQKFKLPM